MGRNKLPPRTRRQVTLDHALDQRIRRFIPADRDSWSRLVERLLQDYLANIDTSGTYKPRGKK